jgi:hypothetical protein
LTCRNASFFEFSLCLSRACLGKMTIFIHKWRKRTRFPYQGGGRRDVVDGADCLAGLRDVSVFVPAFTQKRSFLMSPCLCPEPVLVKCSFFIYKWLKKTKISYHISSSRTSFQKPSRGLPSGLSGATPMPWLCLERGPPAERKRQVVLSFPCVCPEPVLAK